MNANTIQNNEANCDAPITVNGAPVPPHILAHAERCYPSARRPKCPILGRLFDNAKLDCIRGRLRIEAENNFSLPKPGPCDASTESQPLASDADPTSHPTSHPTSSDAEATSCDATSDAVVSDPTPTSCSEIPGFPEIPPPSSNAATDSTNPADAAEPPHPSEPLASSEQSEKLKARRDRDTVLAYINQKNPSSCLRQQAMAVLRARLGKTQNTSSTQPGEPENEQLAEIKECLDPRSPIDQLPLHRQRLLYELIADFGPTAAAAAVSLPEPDGWGLPLKEAACRRFQRRYEKRTHAQRRDDTTHLVNEILTNPAATDEEFNLAAERLFKMRLLQNLNDPGASTKKITALFQTFTRLRRTDLAERKLNLDQKNSP